MVSKTLPNRPKNVMQRAVRTETVFSLNCQTQVALKVLEIQQNIKIFYLNALLFSSYHMPDK